MNNHEKVSEVRILSIGEDNMNVAVFPNPVSDNIYVHDMSPGTNLQLTDARGSAIYRTSAKTPDVIIPANNLAPGVYFLQLTYNNNPGIKTVKVIKR